MPRPAAGSHWCHPAAYELWVLLLNDVLRDSGLGNPVQVQRAAEHPAAAAVAAPPVARTAAADATMPAAAAAGAASQAGAAAAAEAAAAVR